MRSQAARSAGSRAARTVKGEREDPLPNHDDRQHAIDEVRGVLPMMRAE
jgi:hypothetical protein